MNVHELKDIVERRRRGLPVDDVDIEHVLDEVLETMTELGAESIHDIAMVASPEDYGLSFCPNCKCESCVG